MATCAVTFEPMGKTVQVDPENCPHAGHGEPGSLLDVALAAGIELEHACGGVGVCGTCHVQVLTGAENLSEPNEDEMDHIDLVPGNTVNSRLACRAVVQGDVTVHVPAWNRNAARENG